MNTHHDGERILDHTRLQLSALIDGELAPDEAAFLMRRLRHDDELAGCWERWQLAGELLRGRGGARLPDRVRAGVMAAVAAEAPVPAPAQPRRWLHWGGGAIAASVALAALLIARPAGSPQAPAATPAPVLADRAAPAPSRPVAPVASRGQPAPAPVAPDTAGQLAGAAMAVADVPRRVATARRGNAQLQRAAARARERLDAPVAAVASTAPQIVAAPAAADPFSPRHALPASRPWPRSLVPGLPASGAFTVDYGGPAAQSPSFYPFEPQRLQPQRVEPAQDVAP